MQQNLSSCDDVEIARHEVSEDGVNWRPYDPARDTGGLLHKRIEFAPPSSEFSRN